MRKQFLRLKGRIGHVLSTLNVYVKESSLGLLILIISILILVFGYLHLHGWTGKNLIQDFYANFGTEFFGIAITISLVDYLAKKRQD